MLNAIKGLGATLRVMRRRKVTSEYPREHLPIQRRFMGFPALMWDPQREEPYCTGCMVCVRYCPTQCMSAKMQDNPKFASGDSHRRKIIKEFEINLGRCILCAICVEVCNFDAIEMSHEHERGSRARNGNRVDLAQLLEMGRKHQADVNWKPSKPNRPSPKEKEAMAKAKQEKAARAKADEARRESGESQARTPGKAAAS